ncbi:MAG: ribonuclease HI [Sandaracinaceae bacterium]
MSGMPWMEMKLRNAKVLVRCSDGGQPLAEKGRVEIRYKPKDGRAYHASLGNLVPIPGGQTFPDAHCAEAKASPAGGGKSGAKKKSKKAKSPPPPHEEGALIVYADGACSGNPGPAGLGVVVLDGDRRHELTEYLGQGTNNIAELTALLRAAQFLRERSEPVRIYTDSQYSINMLTKGWKAKKNAELIAETKDAMAALDDVALYYVPGHAGVELNECADELATRAVANRASPGWVEVTGPA